MHEENSQGRMMHEPEESALSTRDRYNHYCLRGLINPVFTVNWCLSNLVLLTDLRQTSIHLGVSWKSVHYRKSVHYVI